MQRSRIKNSCIGVRKDGEWIYVLVGGFTQVVSRGSQVNTQVTLPFFPCPHLSPSGRDHLRVFYPFTFSSLLHFLLSYLLHFLLSLFLTVRTIPIHNNNCPLITPYQVTLLNDHNYVFCCISDRTCLPSLGVGLIVSEGKHWSTG